MSKAACCLVLLFMSHDFLGPHASSWGGGSQGPDVCEDSETDACVGHVPTVALWSGAR